MRTLTSLSCAVVLLAALSCGSDPDDENDDAEGQAATSPDAGASPPQPATGPNLQDGGAPPTAPAPFSITSSAGMEGGLLDPAFRCMAPSPPLAWTPGPSGTQSYALVFRDVTYGFYHWFIYDLPSTQLSLPIAVPAGAELAMPSGAKQGLNVLRAPGYLGPCGQQGTNTYAFALYALDVPSLPNVTASSTPAELVAAIEAHDLAVATLTLRSMP